MQGSGLRRRGRLPRGRSLVHLYASWRLCAGVAGAQLDTRSPEEATACPSFPSRKGEAGNKGACLHPGGWARYRGADTRNDGRNGKDALASPKGERPLERLETLNCSAPGITLLIRQKAHPLIGRPSYCIESERSQPFQGRETIPHSNLDGLDTGSPEKLRRNPPSSADGLDRQRRSTFDSMDSPRLAPRFDEILVSKKVEQGAVSKVSVAD